MFVKYGEEYAQLAELQGLTDIAESARREVSSMYEDVYKRQTIPSLQKTRYTTLP